MFKSVGGFDTFCIEKFNASICLVKAKKSFVEGYIKYSLTNSIFLETI